MAERQWFMDDQFGIFLPPDVSEEVRRFYGEGRVGIDFAQALASFLANTRFVITEED